METRFILLLHIELTDQPLDIGSSDLNIKVWCSTREVGEVTGGSRENSVKSCLFSQC